jgi:tRNA threonylcarbamoyladenosine biosynthesis protein TsaB
MHILGIDTSGREGSVALCSGDQHSFDLLESRTLAGGMYSADLMPRIAEILLARNLPKHAVDLYAVCSGPGSFTGLRVGLSTAKGLAEILRKPLVAITVLEAICLNAHAQDASPTLIAALDAQRNEVFTAEFDVATARPTQLSETLLTFNDFALLLKDRNTQHPVYTPDSALHEKISSAGIPVRSVSRPAADSYARIGLAKFFAGQTVSPADLDADYIRRSDAEIFSKPL